MESCKVQCVNRKLKNLVESLEDSYCKELCQNIKCRRERDDTKFAEKRKQGTRNPCIGMLPQAQQYVKIPPKQKDRPIKVTIDGRKVFEKPRCIKKEKFSYRPPPYVRPRSSSVELRGGLHFKECDCVRRNGLQDDCPRWDCAGRPECNDSPWPTCFPQETAPEFGKRKINMKAVSTSPKFNEDIQVTTPEDFQGDIYVCCPE